jgi:hypothetical protein
MRAVFVLAVLFITVAFSYRAEDTTLALSQFYGRKIVRNDAAINAIMNGEHYLSGNYLHDRQDFTIDHYPDPNPEALPRPPGMPVIKIGYVVTDIPSFPNAFYYDLAYKGLREFEYLANVQNITNINSTAHWIEPIVYSGGPQCDNLLIAYERLVVVDKVDGLLFPVSPGCLEIALLAERYKIPCINGVDYALPAVSSFLPPYTTLQYTYSITGTGIGESCIAPLANLGAKTFVIFYDPDAVHDTIPIIDATAQALGLRKVMNDTLLSNAAQTEAIKQGHNCSYIWTFIDQLIIVRPDILIVTFGSLYTDQFVICMHSRKDEDGNIYQPPALFLVTGSTIEGEDIWHTDWSFSTDLWVARATYTDPYLVSVSVFNETYARQYGTEALSQISYAASNAEAAAVLVTAMVMANSLNSTAVINAIPDVAFRGILGDVYLENGTHQFHHPFFCKQRRNDSNPIGPAVYPDDTPGVVQAEFPNEVDPTAEFLESLKVPSGLTRKEKLSLGLGLGLGGALVLTVATIGAIAAYMKWRYHLLAISKKATKKDLSEW